MWGAVIHEFGGCDVFRYEEVADPVAGDHHAVVKVLACGINRYDLYLRMGVVHKDTPLPLVMGADIAGEVVAIEGDTFNLDVGMRVIVAPGFAIDPEEWDDKPENLAPSYTVTGTTLWGGYAQYVTIPTRFLTPDHTSLPPEQVAACPLVVVTAVHAVKTLGQVKAGDRVLIQAGASGSGSMCVQLAKHLGAQVVTTVGSDDKLEFARACGADLVINHRTEDFAERALDWTKGAGVDVVIDNVGGGVFDKNLACLKTGGVLVNFGMVGGVKAELNFAGLIFGQYQIRGSMMGSMDEFREGIGLIERGHLQPKLDRTFPLREAAAAHAYIESRSVQGNVVLLPWA